MPTTGPASSRIPQDPSSRGLVFLIQVLASRFSVLLYLGEQDAGAGWLFDLNHERRIRVASHPRKIFGVSICAGVEGIGLGLKKVLPEIRCVLHIEREFSAAAILAARMRDGLVDETAIWSDLQTADGKEVGDYLREATGGQGIDFVWGGIPCQGN